MPIAHNLSNIADILSGFDPIGGVNGTYGKSYLLRKTFDAFKAFDTNVIEITGASPTPAWLQAEATTLPLIENLLLSSYSSTHFASYYYANDPGLSATVKSVIVYRWYFQASTSNMFFLKQKWFKEDGANYVNPTTDPGLNQNNNNIGFCTLGSTATALTQNLIPKWVFWKSNNAVFILSIDRTNSAYMGGGILLDPAYTGYLQDGTELINGGNFRLNVIVFNNAISNIFMPFQAFSAYSSTLNYLNPSQSYLTSIGNIFPATQFVIGGLQRMLGGKLKIGFADSTVAVVSSELEGVSVSNVTINPNFGVSLPYNGGYYLAGPRIFDGRTQARLLLQL